jgi:hypothetical protein
MSSTEKSEKDDETRDFDCSIPKSSSSEHLLTSHSYGEHNRVDVKKEEEQGEKEEKKKKKKERKKKL